MICSQRGSLGKYVSFFWEKTLCQTAKWMPHGFLPKTAIWISSEAIGAVTLEKALPLFLDRGDQLAENYLPYYRQLPLLGMLSLVILASRSSRVALTIISSLLVLLFTVYSGDELEKSASKIAGLCIYYLAGMFASITGGYLGLALTHTSEVFSDYRRKMIEHAFAGQAFEACIIKANITPLIIIRFLCRTFFQMAAYNRKSLFHAFKISARKGPSYGILGPAFTRLLYERFQEIDNKSIAERLSRGFLPFFSEQKTSFFAANCIDPIVSKKIRDLQKNSGCLVNILSRSLLQYFLLLEDQKTTTLPAALTIIGNNVLWNEENLTAATTFINQTLQTIGVSLIGKKVYPSSHLEFMEKTIRFHLKSFLCFTIARGLDPAISRGPLDEAEELQLISVIHHILFRSLIRPLLPETLSSGLQKTLQVALKIVVKTVHKLQGIKPKVQIIDKTALRAPIRSYAAAPLQAQALDPAALAAPNESYGAVPIETKVIDSSALSNPMPSHYSPPTAPQIPDDYVEVPDWTRE